ncbi:MAG: SH3 domain-containing protein [Hydrococcus sp. Prado102]|nr:SH3 domain-containing protein [Hydrococcus sp. Prado102]
MKRVSNIVQFIIGFILGLAILAGGTAAVAYVFFAKMNANPPKPMFAEEKKEETPKTAQKPSTPQATPVAAASPEPEKPPENLPPGAYKARVTWAEGLSVRTEPGREAERIAGVDYNQELIVLQESEDKQWQKIRLAEGTLEGWIKAGNVEKVETSN